MATKDLNQATTSGLKSAVQDYSVSSKVIDAPSQTTETTWENPYWSKYLGYYKQIPEFKEAIRALARWAIGRGYNTDVMTKIALEHIKGAGEDTFQSIMTNHLIVKKVNGDAYCEIIRDDKSGKLINLKPLNPATMRTIFNSKGLIIRYEEIDSGTKKAKRTFNTREILHSMNDRIANEIHGISVLEACQWVIDARNEAMVDKRRVHHRSTIRIIEVDSDDPTKLTSLKNQYAEAIKNGEVLIVPKDNVSFPNAPINYIDTLDWIQYLEGFFYQAVGVPRAIANTQDFTEAASKVGYMTFEPVYVEEQTLLEQDLWNQLGIKVKFNRPPALAGAMQESEAANTGQVSFQPNEMTAQIGRNE